MKKRGYFLLVLIVSLIFTLGIVTSLNYNGKGILKVTNEHPFLLNGKWIVANDLKVGDKLFLLNGKKAKITSIKDVYEETFVYNLEANSYSDFILSNGIIVHNSNVPKLDCVLGSCKVDVIYPDGIEQMTFSKFYQKYQNNPSLRIIGSDGSAITLDGIIRTVNLDSETQIVRFKVNEQTLRLTSEHEIQLMDGTFVKAGDLRNGMMVKTDAGPVRIEELTSYKASGVKAYDIKTSQPYSLTGDGPILKPSSTPTQGILPGASNWDESRVYARIVSDAEYNEIMRTGTLRPSEEGQLIPTIDAQNKKALDRLSGMSQNELKTYYKDVLGGNGPNKKIIFFRSKSPPEIDGIGLRDASDVQEAKFTGGKIEILN